MNVNEMADYLEENGIATDSEIRLVSDINGWSEESMLDILYAKTGYRSFEQLEDAEGDFLDSGCHGKNKGKDDKKKKSIKSDYSDEEYWEDPQLKTTVWAGNNEVTLDESPAEHIKKNLDAYVGYMPYDMEKLVLEPSGYEKYYEKEGHNGEKKIIYKKPGAGMITLFFDENNELENIKSSRKAIKSSSAFGMLQYDISEMSRRREEKGDLKFAMNAMAAAKEFLVAAMDEVEEHSDSESAFLSAINELDDLLEDLYNKSKESEGIKSSRKPLKSSYDKLIGEGNGYQIVLDGDEYQLLKGGEVVDSVKLDGASESRLEKWAVVNDIAMKPEYLNNVGKERMKELSNSRNNAAVKSVFSSKR